jgi:hypothetical protein
MSRPAALKRRELQQMQIAKLNTTVGYTPWFGAIPFFESFRICPAFPNLFNTQLRAPLKNQFKSAGPVRAEGAVFVHRVAPLLNSNWKILFLKDAAVCHNFHVTSRPVQKTCRKSASNSDSEKTIFLKWSKLNEPDELKIDSIRICGAHRTT